MSHKEFRFGVEVEIVKALKAKEPEKGELVMWAYASTWDVDSDHCQITREALEGAKNDLLEYSTVLFNHNYDRPIGRVVETKIDDKGLLVKIAISNSEKDICEKIVDGTLSKLSISGRATEMQETSPDENGMSILQITKIKLFEVSLVSVPANKEAQTLSHYIQKAFDFSKSIEDLPFDKSLLTELELLAGRSTGDAKATLDKVISFFKTKNKDEEKSMTYKLNDESETRPIFQVNLSDSSKVELADGHKFRKQILKKGKWYHWAVDKGELVIDDSNIDALVKNFNANILEKVSVPLTHSDNPALNTGEVLELIKTEDGLDAVIDIKDATVVEKIEKGLITAISASFDPNYMVKKTKEFVGPVLQHVALVSEPYIKGMRKFVALSDEFEGRTVISLEDAEYNIQKQLEVATELLLDIKKHLEKTEVTKEKESNETEVIKEKEETIIKANVGDECTMDDGTKGTMHDEDGKMVCKSVVVEKEKEPEVPPAASTETKVEKSEEKTDSVSLSDGEALYTEFLHQGKILPTQKETFMQLVSNLHKVSLSDSTVDVKSELTAFYALQPKIVNFDETGVVSDPAPKPADNIPPVETTIPDEVKDFYRKMDFTDSQITDAWKYAKTELGAGEKSTIFGN